MRRRQPCRRTQSAPQSRLGIRALVLLLAAVSQPGGSMARGRAGRRRRRWRWRWWRRPAGSLGRLQARGAGSERAAGGSEVSGGPPSPPTPHSSPPPSPNLSLSRTASRNVPSSGAIRAEQMSIHCCQGEKKDFCSELSWNELVNCTTKWLLKMRRRQRCHDRSMDDIESIFTIYYLYAVLASDLLLSNPLL